MERFRLTGPQRLAGRVAVSGAKNSVLKLMAATLLAEGRSEISNVPDILDVAIMSELLRRLGCEVSREGDRLLIDVPAEPGVEADYDLVRRMRASISVLGPLLGRRHLVRVAMPGGDAIGSRGLDLHIEGLTRLGATVRSEHGFLIAEADKLVGTSIWLGFPSVGATENILMAAVTAEGTTVIDNAAREPEIVDLIEMLTAMGARIEGAATPTLLIEGVPELHPATHRAVPDRIVAGTWAIAAAITGGDITIDGARADHLGVALGKLRDVGAQVTSFDGGLRVQMDRRPVAVDFSTLPYPGFPTDLQPQMIALASISEGTSVATENVFEARFMFVHELARLGAQIRIDGHQAIVRGVEGLSGAPVRATDVRAGVGLVLAGLAAEGETIVSDISHIDRGYEHLAQQLDELGATILREPEPSDALG